MKYLSVTIRAELEVPDGWELVDHPSGVRALKIGEQFVEFDLSPFATDSISGDAEWSNDNVELIERVLDTVVDSDADVVLRTRH